MLIFECSIITAPGSGYVNRNSEQSYLFPFMKADQSGYSYMFPTIQSGLESMLSTPNICAQTLVLKVKSIYFRAGFFDFSFVSISNVLSAWFQYEALKLVNFTTVVLFKGSRILPVMIMGRIISKTKNSAFDWITAVLLCVGSVMFMVSKDINTDNKGYEHIISGIVCLILYVAFGSFSKKWSFMAVKISSPRNFRPVKIFRKR